MAPIGKFVYQPDIYTFRAGIETAGNLLYAGSSLSKQKRDPNSQAYKVFGIQYSQYVKLNLDYTYNHSFDRRNALVLHIGAGAAVPYGNSTILPFEKRFYSGGANSVRGWSVRTLGPGRFNGDNSVSSFMEQCGDIRLDLNMEYRAKLSGCLRWRHSSTPATSGQYAATRTSQEACSNSTRSTRKSPPPTASVSV